MSGEGIESKRLGIVGIYVLKHVDDKIDTTVILYLGQRIVIEEIAHNYVVVAFFYKCGHGVTLVKKALDHGEELTVELLVGELCRQGCRLQSFADTSAVVCRCYHKYFFVIRVGRKRMHAIVFDENYVVSLGREALVIYGGDDFSLGNIEDFDAFVEVLGDASAVAYLGYEVRVLVVSILVYDVIHIVTPI